MFWMGDLFVSAKARLQCTVFFAIEVISQRNAIAKRNQKCASDQCGLGTGVQPRPTQVAFKQTVLI